MDNNLGKKHYDVIVIGGGATEPVRHVTVR